MFGHTEVKGSSVMIAPIFIKEKFGEEGYNKWLEKLPPETKKDFEMGILISKWYPVLTHFSYPNQLICDLFYQGDIKGAWENGYYGAKYSLKGIYASVIKIFSIETVINKSSILFATSWRPSELKVIEHDKFHGVVHITKFPEITTYIEAAIAGYITYMGEATGVKNVNIEITKSMAGGDQYTEFICTWI